MRPTEHITLTLTIDFMNAKVETFESGWCGISLALAPDEIELLLRRLAELRSGSVNHFHMRTDDFSPDKGVADIEFTILGEGESNNMSID